MLNQVTLLGRITRELELKKAPDNQSVLEFTLACESDQRSKEDKPDYIERDCYLNLIIKVSIYMGIQKLLDLRER